MPTNLRSLIAALRTRMFDRYEPARHYMRGPGPARLAKTRRLTEAPRDGGSAAASGAAKR